MSKQLREEIKSVEKATKDIVRMTVASGYISANAVPGQFVNIKCCDDIQPLLRRPVSICSVDRTKGEFDLYFQIKGQGTEMLAGKKRGDLLDMIGPLGRGFDLDIGYRRIAVAGGGWYSAAVSAGESKAVVSHTGFRSYEQILLGKNRQVNSWKRQRTEVSGEGIVTDIRKGHFVGKFDMIYACVQIRCLREYRNRRQKPCQVPGIAGTGWDADSAHA